MEARMNVAEIVTERIVAQLEQGVAPWRKPWATVGHQWAANLISKRHYSGCNQFLLQVSGYSSPFWLTYKQASALGGNVKRGEKGTPVIYVGRATDKKSTADEKKSFTFLKYFTVFNVEQCEGIDAHVPAPAVVDTTPKAKIERAEAIVTGYKNAPTIGTAANAWYRPATDHVGIPALDLFESADHYYSTLFHELGHSTGHVSRLDRKLDNGFGSELYGKEELVAELTAAFLANTAGIDNIAANASYCKSWITVLKGDAKLLISAAAAAQKAFECIHPSAAVAEGEQQQQEAA